MKTIILNGRRRSIEKPELSYEDVLCMAEQPAGATVVYHVKGGASGSLYSGKKPVEVVDGMLIECIVTGNA